MAIGLGDEVVWYSPTVDPTFPYRDNAGAVNLTNGLTSIVPDTGAGGTDKYQFLGNTSSYCTANQVVTSTTSFSVSAWINGNPSGSEVVGVVAQSNISNQRGFLFGSYQNAGQGGNGSKLHAFYQSNPTTYNANERLQSNATVFDNTWHHVVFTFGGGRVNIYVDGVLDATRTSNVPSQISALHPFELGRYAGSNAYNGGPANRPPVSFGRQFLLFFFPRCPRLHLFYIFRGPAGMIRHVPLVTIPLFFECGQ